MISKNDGTTGLILLVEDNAQLAETIGEYLEMSGLRLDFARDGLSALHLIATQVYDAIILDLGLPGADGYQVCQRLRQDANKDTPVLILSARDSIDDKLEGFRVGADDYMVKPVNLKELEARVLAHLRRRRGEVVEQIFKVGDLTLDISTHQVKRAEKAITLSPTCLKILKILMRESPAVVSRQAIENELWGDELPDSDTLRSHLYKLRKAIDRPFLKPLIHTIQGVGFKATEEV
ncbi:MAG: response regulator transcription factor [Pseudomonadota bacterium]